MYATGDPSLAIVLREAGLEVVDDPSRADALLADLPDGAADGALTAAVDALPDGAVVGVAVAGGSPIVVPDPSPVRRVGQLLASPLDSASARRQTARVEALLRPLTGPLQRVPTGDRTRLAGIGARALARLRRPPLGWLLVSRPPERPSVVERAVQAAREALGAPLEVEWMATQPSAKLLVHVRDGRHLLRVAARPARPFLDGAVQALHTLVTDRPADVVAARLAPFDAAGEVGVAAWALERRRAGSHPRTVGPGLWQECWEFLLALRAVREEAAGSRERLRERFDAQAARLARDAAPESVERIEALPGDLARRLAGVPLGWTHGDFWSGNLLVRGGALEAVIDWEWAVPDGLPVLDLFDHIVLGPRETRYLPPGPRLLEILLPLARAGGDERVREYCRALGLAPDPGMLEALAVAYWLDRTARWLAPFDSRRHVEGWLAANVDGPVAALGRPGADRP